MATRLKPSRINVDNTPRVGEGAAYKTDDDFHWSMGGWDMAYEDFEWKTLTGNPITIQDLNSIVTPSDNFVVLAGTLKPWMDYVLRVNMGSTDYAMTLGAGITNPEWYDLTLQKNSVNQFEFVATSTSQLELKWVDQAFVTINTNQSISGKKTFTTEPALPNKTSTATNDGTKPATEKQVYDVAQELDTLNQNVVKLTGDQTVNGTKTFGTSPVVPNKTAAATNDWTAIATEKQVYDVAQDTATKANKVSSATADHLASLTSGGDLADSGIAKSTVELNTNKETGDAPTDTTSKYPSSHTVKKYVDDQVASATAGAVSNEAYDSTTWNGVTWIAPSKNAVRDKIVSMDSNISWNATDISTINGKIPSTASTSNQLADKAFVNSSINSVTAFYITKNAAGDQFATYAELAAATTFYSGGEVRVPTRNDYCIVQDDENHDDATTRYIYNSWWEYQYTINETPLTQAQLDALNSGITSGKVSTYDWYATSKQNTLTAGDNITINGATISANVNVKSFELNGSTDTTNALKAAQWYNSGNLPIIKYVEYGEPTIYYLKEVSTISEIWWDRYSLNFYSPTIVGNEVKRLNIYTNVWVTSCTLTLSTSSLYSAGTGIGISNSNVISNSWVTSVGGQTGSVTLKTVNSNSLVGSGDIVIDAVIKSATAPSPASEWDLWYDTANDQLKVTADGTNWTVVGKEYPTLTASKIQTGTETTASVVTAAVLAWSVIRIHPSSPITPKYIWIWTQAQYEALSSTDSQTLYFTTDS